MILEDAVSSQGAVAVLYMYIIITIGTWFLLNLFTAILIKAFAEQKEIAKRRRLHRLERYFARRVYREAALQHTPADSTVPDDLVIERIYEMFDQCDTDCSGDLDMLELHRGFHSMGHMLRPREVSQIVRMFDVEVSGTLDFEEFFDMIMSMCRTILEERGKILPTRAHMIRIRRRALSLV